MEILRSQGWEGVQPFPNSELLEVLTNPKTKGWVCWCCWSSPGIPSSPVQVQAGNLSRMSLGVLFWCSLSGYKSPNPENVGKLTNSFELLKNSDFSLGWLGFGFASTAIFWLRQQLLKRGASMGKQGGGFAESWCFCEEPSCSCASPTFPTAEGNGDGKAKS